ncbi:MAG: alpha/beta hydrolase family protein [Kiritimatiellia bacterium]|jgi:acetyl esterase/lipase
MEQPTIPGWPAEIRAVEFPASIDNTRQPMLAYTPATKGKRPLLIGLHTWSGDYRQAGTEVIYAQWCMAHDWHFIHPDFRGQNSTADACGSEKVVQDIIDAVAYMAKHYEIDPDRVYLAGQSGGGHAALLMAGRAPHLWAGVSAWVPISDIREWWKQKDAGQYPFYARNIESAVGGRPDQSGTAAQECVRRSPNTYLGRAAGVNMDINAGVTDGHDGGSVPFTHALYAFNHIVPERDRIEEPFIEAFYERQKLPDGVPLADPDPLYGQKRVLFRKVSNNTRVTIFQGGHEIIHNAALTWLAHQRRGQPAKWDITADNTPGTAPPF